MKNPFWYKLQFHETRCYKNMLEFVKMSTDAAHNAKFNKNDISIYCKKNFIKEYCVINYKGPRQIGHTTSALKISDDLFKHTLYVAPNLGMLKYVIEKKKYLNTNNDMYFVTEKMIQNEIARLKDYDFIVLDVSTLFKDLTSVLKKLCENCEDTVTILCL